MCGAIPPLRYMLQWHGASFRTEKFTEPSPPSRLLTKLSHSNGIHMLVTVGSDLLMQRERLSGYWLPNTITAGEKFPSSD